MEELLNMTESEENKLLWNALRDIAYQSQSHEESKRLAQAAVDAVCPFLPLMVTHPTEEARKAS
jgi:hypothetical protein